jgi:hypothetical protein
MKMIKYNDKVKMLRWKLLGIKKYRVKWEIIEIEDY